MKKLVLASVLLFSSVQVLAAEYYSVYGFEDCVMADQSIVNTPDWFNVENIIGKLIYPAIIKTDSSREKADMTVYELRKIAGEYWANVRTKEDVDLAIHCKALKADEIN